MLEHALRYHDLGYSVIPCHPRTKVAKVRWQEFSKTRPTKEQIIQWWTDDPDANIAIVTGRVSGIVVADVDTGKGGSIHDLTRSDCIVATGSRYKGEPGYHVYYAYPKDQTRVPNRVNLQPGLDVRADGGYVLAPPSIHDKTGEVYDWIVQENPAECPALLYTKKSDTKNTNDDRWLTNTVRSGFGSEGGRNDLATRLAGYYVGKGFPRDLTTLLIEQANERGPEPLDPKELDTIVDSAYRTSKRNHPDGEGVDASSFSLTSLADFMLEHGEHATSWVVKDWIVSEAVAMITAEPESYKTWILFDLAVSVASGAKFLGHFDVLDPGPVLIVNQEDHPGQTAERLGVIARSKFPKTQHASGGVFRTESIPELPIYLHKDGRLRFNDRTVVKQLEDRIREIKPKLLIIDPFYSVVSSTDDYFAGDLQDLQILKEWRKLGVTTILAHHRKKSAEGFSRLGAWGSAFINAFLDMGFQIVRPDEEHRERVALLKHFKSATSGKVVQLTFDISTANQGKYSVEIGEFEGFKKKGEGQADQILELLKVTDIPKTVLEIASALGLRESEVHRRIRKLLKRDEIEESVKDKTKAYHYKVLPLER